MDPNEGRVTEPAGHGHGVIVTCDEADLPELVKLLTDWRNNHAAVARLHPTLNSKSPVTLWAGEMPTFLKGFCGKEYQT